MKTTVLTFLICTVCLTISAEDHDHQFCKIRSHSITINKDGTYIYTIFNNLRMAYDAACTIQDEESRTVICNFLELLDAKLYTHYMAKNYAKMREEAEMFYENVEEILSICKDCPQNSEIQSNIAAIVEILNR